MTKLNLVFLAIQVENCNKNLQDLFQTKVLECQETARAALELDESS